MDKDPRFPDFTGDTRIDNEEAVRFQKEIVHKAINYLWGGNFVGDLKPGHNYSKTVAMERDDEEESWCTLDLESVIDPYGDDPDEGDWVFLMNLSIATRRDELMDDLMGAYAAERIEAVEKAGRKVTSRKRRHIIKEVLAEELLSWERVSYDFSHVEGDGFRVTKTLELWDKALDGGIRWSTDSFMWDLETPETSHQASADSINLDEEFDTNITPEDFFQIMDAFKALGVPESAYGEAP